MKILVTGGAGFIGSHVVEGYLTHGHDVVVVDNLSRGNPGNLPPGVRLYPVDIRNGTELGAIFDRHTPDVVSHHAAQIDVRRSVREPAFDASVNVVGSLNVLEQAVKHHVQRFIFASSGGAVYGEPRFLPVHEGAKARPICPNGVSKRAFEQYLCAEGLNGVPFVILRYGNVYGPRQSSKGEAGVVAIFCEQMFCGITPTIYGDGTKTRDYVEVADVVRANLNALNSETNQILNIGSGVKTSDFQVFEAVRDAVGFEEQVPLYAPMRPGEVVNMRLDCSRAAVGLRWKARVPLEEGVARAAEWFRRRL